MRGAVATVRRKDRRDLGNAQVEESRLDDHLRRKLHAGRLQFQFVARILAKTAQTALKIADRTAKEHAPEPAQERVSQVVAQMRHGVRADSSLEAISHH